MEKVQLFLDNSGKGKFFILEEEKEMAEMTISIHGPLLTAYHTEVVTEAEGKGYAKALLETMTGYVREHGLKVVPLCPYVLAQFRRHPETYTDIWQKSTIRG